MKERKIITDRSFPSEAEINQFKNFEKIKSNHLMAKKLFLKKLWFGIGAAVTVVAVTTAVLVFNSKDKSVDAPAAEVPATVAQEYIAPPIAGADITYTSYVVSGTSASTITYSTGSTLKIPAAAFVTAQNEPVGDSVKIMYREFHTPGDIFLAGIPMNYDSAGTQHQLESAGMFEIRAFSKDQELKLASGKQIDVKLATNSADERFDVYALDTAAKTWQYKGADKIVAQDLTYKFKAESPVQQRDEPVQAVQAPPQLPAKASDSKFKFKIEFDAKYFPELASFKNVQFEVADKNFSYKFYETEWEEMILSAGEKQGTYVMKLQKEDTTVKVLVQPVLSAKDYEKALQEFEQKHTEYRDEADKRTRNQNAKLGNEGNYKVTNQAAIIAQINRLSRANTFREFAISGLGYHNIDAVIGNLLTGIFRLRAEPREEVKKPMEFAEYSNIYVGVKGKNTVYRYSRYQAIKLDTKAQNLVWTVTDNGQIAFFDADAFTNSSDKSNVLAIPIIASDQKGALDRINSLNS